MTLADAELLAAQYRLEIARADLALDVRNQFAAAVAARDSLALARENETRARELVRVAQAMVDPGHEPPLRAFRAKAALVQATDRKSVVSGKRVSVRVDPGGRRILKKKKHT